MQALLLAASDASQLVVVASFSSLAASHSTELEPLE